MQLISDLIYQLDYRISQIELETRLLGSGMAENRRNLPNSTHMEAKFSVKLNLLP